MKYRSVSIYTMWTYISRFLFLLIIPLIQQIILSVTGIKEIIYTMWPSMTILGIILIISFIKYKSLKYAINKNNLFLNKGFLIKRKLAVPIRSINVIDKKCTIILSLFKSEKISFYLNAKNEKINNLILKKGELKNILNENNIRKIVKTKPIKILFMAISWSNPVISLLIAIPFVNKLGNIVGEETTKRLYSTMDTVLKLIKIGIPPLIAGISYLLLGAFFVTVTIHFFRYANFTTIITDNTVIIKSGLISENKKTIRKNKINTLIIKQSFFMIIFKVYSIYASIIGVPKTKGEYNLLFAGLKKEEIIGAINSLYNDSADKLACVRPHKKRIINFLLLPIISFLILIFSVVIFLQDKWYNRIIIFSLLFIAIFILWWMLIRYFAYKFAEVSISKTTLNINGFKLLSLYCGIIPIDKIQSISIKRNPFFKWSHLCKLQVKSYSGKDNNFVCKYLDYDDLSKFLSFIN